MKDVAVTISNVLEVVKQVLALVASKPKAKFRLTLVEWRKRSLSANGQQHIWYSILNKHFGFLTELIDSETGEKIEVNPGKEICKVMFGIPIILNNSQFGYSISKTLDAIDYYNMSFDEQCESLRIISVTSLFTVKESKEYMDNMVFYFSDKEVDINYSRQ